MYSFIYVLIIIIYIYCTFNFTVLLGHRPLYMLIMLNYRIIVVYCTK